MDKSNRVIFLDIDGVLQPLNDQNRFKHNLEELKKTLAAKYHNDEYLEMDQYDLGAVYYDWDKEAVERLRQLCINTGAKIVISSDWRTFSPLSRLKDYFRLHDLDQYIIGETADIPKIYRWGEIADYLEKHPEIENFVIIDDRFYKQFQQHYPGKLVYCDNVFEQKNYHQAIEILTGRIETS